ncbi:MAG: type II secretion system F family protein [Candidatus Hydrogenedentes bacterium]|nr:type II secretion system F family protein [Candidatus Hydrogenedentota bacterium]
MNWRELFSIDVASLFRRGQSPRLAPTMFLRRWRKRRKAEPPKLVFRRAEWWPGPWYLRRKKWRRDLLSVTGQLAAIVRSNSPMIGGLEAAALDAPGAGLQDVFLVLRDDIESGLSLTEAMLRRPRFFPRFYADLVKVGEETGKLYGTLTELNDELLETMVFRDIFRIYLLYITIVLAAVCSVQALLCTRVVPVFAELLANFEAEVPRSTAALIAFSNYVVCGGWRTILVTVCLVAIAGNILHRLLRRRGMISAAVGRLLMCVPFLRSIVVKRNLAQAALVLEKLLAGRVPLDAALEDAASLDISPIYRATMRRLGKSVQNGETLNAAMEKERLLPASFRGLVSIGESSGLLPEAFGRIALLYRREAIKTGKILIDVLTPAGVVVLGCLTLLVTLSVFAMHVEVMKVLIASI